MKPLTWIPLAAAFAAIQTGCVAPEDIDSMALQPPPTTVFQPTSLRNSLWTPAAELLETEQGDPASR